MDSRLQDAAYRSKPPSIEIMLPNGKVFNCDSITTESAKDYFPHHMEFEDSMFDKQLDKSLQGL